jgi:hypothetical protein
VEFEELSLSSRALWNAINSNAQKTILRFVICGRNYLANEFVMLHASGVEMLPALDNSGPFDSANPDFKHLGQAPARASRHRAPVQPPAVRQHFFTLASNPDQTESELPTHVSTFTDPLSETANKLSPNSTKTSTEAGNMRQTPVRSTKFTTEFAEHHIRERQISYDAASQSAQKIAARDSEHKASVIMLLQQLDELAVSKQRTAEEFRASQQLTAQALRRLDEECDRRQQLELRVLENEAALNVLGRMFEDKTKELALMCSKLEVAESRASHLEQQLSIISTRTVKPAENKLHDVQEEPAQKKRMELQVISVCNINSLTNICEK